jgi:hypothetical protein
LPFVKSLQFGSIRVENVEILLAQWYSAMRLNSECVFADFDTVSVNLRVTTPYILLLSDVEDIEAFTSLTVT